jgi:hypothetical protein
MACIVVGISKRRKTSCHAVFSLTLYGILKAIGAGGGLDALKAQMGAGFARGPKAPPPAPPAP